MLRSLIRTKAVPVLVLVLSVAAIGAITLLQQGAGAGRDAQLRLAQLQTALTELQSAPFRSSARTGGSPELARKQMDGNKREVARTLAVLRRRSPVPALAEMSRPLRANYAMLDEIYAIGASGGDFGPRADRLSGLAAVQMGSVTGALAKASREYDQRASTSDTRATAGSVAAIVLLVLAFMALYRRSARARSVAERLARENERLEAANRDEARTDALTALGNRRALLDDVASELRNTGDERELALAIFDLDGFKQYNDTFGHPAGDALLARLGARLRDAVPGSAYRMGGDEFCVVARVEAGEAGELVLRAGEALTESGEAFAIGCSHGIAMLPAEVTTSDDALRLADQRMYADKAGRSSASRQSTDVLLKVLSERSIELREHISGVSEMAAQTAERLGLSAHETTLIGLAAELHDVGKTAIPDAILNKPGPLDAGEWEFMRRHTVIGERIVLAAPSLAPTAPLVRSSHERFDGTGYPDGLPGAAIPIGAAIIAVCDAFDAMISERPYSCTMSSEDALDELRRCAGSQFDPRVVEAFCALAGERSSALLAV